MKEPSRLSPANDTQIVVTHSPPHGRAAILFSQLLETAPSNAVDSAHAAINADEVAKFLFTSGSTAMPKGVINTHRMICSNLQMINQVFGFLEEEPPVLVDWLPWNHTFGGNHNTGISLYNGGTFYIDDGRPGLESFRETLRNLREISTTVFFNVPKGLRRPAAGAALRPPVARHFFPPVEAALLRRCGAFATHVGRLPRARARSLRRTHHHGHRPRRHGNRADGRFKRHGRRTMPALSEFPCRASS